MSTKEELQSSPLNAVKLILAVVLVVAGIVAYYWFTDQAIVVRVLMLLAGAVCGVAVAYSAEQGKTLVGFFKEARTELRRVYWPTRKETLQMSLLVYVVVIIAMIFLLLLDMLLLWGLSFITG